MIDGNEEYKFSSPIRGTQVPKRKYEIRISKYEEEKIQRIKSQKSALPPLNL
jgi:hypothetical protein